MFICFLRVTGGVSGISCSTDAPDEAFISRWRVRHRAAFSQPGWIGRGTRAMSERRMLHDSIRPPRARGCGDAADVRVGRASMRPCIGSNPIPQPHISAKDFAPPLAADRVNWHPRRFCTPFQSGAEVPFCAPTLRRSPRFERVSKTVIVDFATRNPGRAVAGDRAARAMKEPGTPRNSVPLKIESPIKRASTASFSSRGSAQGLFWQVPTRLRKRRPVTANRRVQRLAQPGKTLLRDFKSPSTNRGRGE